MECDDPVKNGLCCSEVHVRGGRVALQLGAGGASALRLVGAARLPGGPAVHVLVPAPTSHATDHPFMSTMDEITYWIYTKRAPCLMSYDNISRKQREEAHCSKTKPKSVPSNAEVPSPKKKKKRKMSLLDDDSASVERQQNVYFDSPQNKKQTVMSSCKSESMGSDIDFNIRDCQMQRKQKRSKLQKNKSTLHKKKKVVTSTPKVSQLRRSVRQAQQSLNNNSQLNSSFEVNNTSFINGHSQDHSVMEHNSPENTKKSTELLAGGDQSTDNKKSTAINKFNNKSKNEVLNGQFEDLSDVSGFTANYIRSTKLQSTKTPRKLRCKNNRNLVKESKQSVLKDSRMIVCADKSVNTPAQNTAHNCSTESENVINLVTTKSAEKTATVSKSTSLLKFMDSRPVKEGASKKKVEVARSRAKTTQNVSFQSQSIAPRYPKRCRNSSTNQDEEVSEANQADKKRKTSKNSNYFNNSDRKENPEAATVSKTRSGRSIGLSLRQPENTMLVLSNSTEQVSSLVSMNVASSMVSMNVASPKVEPKERKKKRITRYLRSKKVNDKNESLGRDSLRDKSGFTACFSDSDDDSEPLKQRKFFCA